MCIFEFDPTHHFLGARIDLVKKKLSLLLFDGSNLSTCAAMVGLGDWCYSRATMNGALSGLRKALNLNFVPFSHDC